MLPGLHGSGLGESLGSATRPMLRLPLDSRQLRGVNFVDKVGKNSASFDAGELPIVADHDKVNVALGLLRERKEPLHPGSIHHPGLVQHDQDLACQFCVGMMGGVILIPQ
jgi:hypothetical protein